LIAPSSPTSNGASNHGRAAWTDGLGHDLQSFDEDEGAEEDWDFDDNGTVEANDEEIE